MQSSAGGGAIGNASEKVKREEIEYKREVRRRTVNASTERKRTKSRGSRRTSAQKISSGGQRFAKERIKRDLSSKNYPKNRQNRKKASGGEGRRTETTVGTGEKAQKFVDVQEWTHRTPRWGGLGQSRDNLALKMKGKRIGKDRPRGVRVRSCAQPWGKKKKMWSGPYLEQKVLKRGWNVKWRKGNYSPPVLLK